MMTDTLLANGWTIRPVEVDGAIQLCDIYDRDGNWHGSRRTVDQCRKIIDQLASANADERCVRCGQPLDTVRFAAPTGLICHRCKGRERKQRRR